MILKPVLAFKYVKTWKGNNYPTNRSPIHQKIMHLGYRFTGACRPLRFLCRSLWQTDFFPVFVLQKSSEVFLLCFTTLWISFSSVSSLLKSDFTKVADVHEIQSMCLWDWHYLTTFANQTNSIKLSRWINHKQWSLYNDTLNKMLWNKVTF